jgi:hypothetical protein
MELTVTRIEIINELKKYFDIRELVGRDVFKLFGKNAWQVFDTDLLHTLLVVRVKIDRPITANNWHKGGSYDERGFRSNIQPIVKNKTLKNQLYVSGHPLGKAIDFVVKGMTAEEVRDWLEENQELLPYKIRLEWKIQKTGLPISWVHLDTKYTEENPKVYKFNV